MKIQDIVFFCVLVLLFILRKDRWFLFAGIAAFVLAIPLFATWTFFTAERLTWYGSACIALYIMKQLFFVQKERSV